MHAAVAPFPADLALRRQLWRQWVRYDAPQGDRGRAMPAHKHTTRSQISLPKARPSDRNPFGDLRLVRQSVRRAPVRSIGSLVAWCVALEAVAVAGVTCYLRV